MKWAVPKIWEDGECFIIGGGPSIIKQFNIPLEVVDKVIVKQTSPLSYSPYLSDLHNKHVIGVNQAFRFGSWIDVTFFGDKGFFLRNLEGLSKCSNIRAGCVPYFEDITWVKYLRKDNKKTEGITTDPTKLSWNGNSGAAAINLAVHLGVKRIVLIGFDMNVDGNERQWWHQLYHNRPLHKGQKVFLRHLTCFPQIAHDAKELGVEILNANPDSAINDFKKLNIKECL